MIKPAKRGDYDSLCGYYAFQNVMRLMNPKMVLDTSDFGQWFKIVYAAGHPSGVQDGLSRVGMLALAKGVRAKGPMKERFAFEVPRGCRARRRGASGDPAIPRCGREPAYVG